MAEQRTAVLEAAREIGAHTRLLQFAMEAPLSFSGGQYIIVHTGIEIAGGKTAKRAYSMLSGDREQHRFELAVRRVGEGPGSNMMHRLTVGSELSFTGPWGKLGPGSRPEAPTASGLALVVATDTGITAAMGLLNSVAFQPYMAEADVYWLLESDQYFLTVDFVRERIQGRCRNFVVRPAPTVNSSYRKAWIEAFVEEMADRQASVSRHRSAFLSGDGMVLFPLRERLVESGIEDVRIETFFNHQEKKAALQTAAS